jgi:hypothetical protein
MRLIKVKDVILNMDRIAVIRGKVQGGGGVSVYAYVDSSNYVNLGVCETQEDYEEFMDGLYEALGEQFTREVVIDKDKELWE